MSSVSTTTTPAEAEQDAPKQKSSMWSYRLLYRGSLALPDSEMLLDGIIFVMQIAKNSPISLINSPIPLGLESMRGRSLSLISTVSIRDMYVECFGDVSMYIHPDAFLTRSFFERTLCMDNPTAPLLPDSNFTYLRTSIAVRIGLGDGTGPEESDILVFGQIATPHPSDPSTPAPTSSSKSLQLLAGRIAPLPVQAQQPQERKITRPDDPLPRSHPLANIHLSPGRRGLKRKRSSNNPLGLPGITGIPGGNGNGDAGSALMAALAQAQAQGERLKKQGKILVDNPGAKGLAKRPTLFQHHHSAPSTSGARGQSVDRDGFLVPNVPSRVLSVRQKDKDKVKSPLKPEEAAGSRHEATTGGPSNSTEPETEIEEKNKTAIKKRTLSALEACGISKQHAQFRDMYGWIHRGVAFSVRGVIRDTKVDRDLLAKLIEVHLEMYMGGRGGKYQFQVQSQSPAAPQSQAPSGSNSNASLTFRSPNGATAPTSTHHTSDTGELGPNEPDIDRAFGSRPLLPSPGAPPSSLHAQSVDVSTSFSDKDVD
ncbi:hypothetical protein M408DRAFT_27708 [Serendipita vermifera MAFF 305830]|uniref:Sld7 C-terminal domain-containing protein n=1 Tax=Serendipita vermifera MAFF 305830 TaxID=933852 RepID=A0A0C2WB49_SERVB|nr:hypothetical protein M408DRAFT_27708 [Serendipita vermifera MAFF 305830]